MSEPCVARTAAAIRLNALADHYHRVQHGDQQTASEAFMAVIYQLDKLVVDHYRRLYLGGVCIELDDYRQEVALKLWRVIRYYAPSKGTFANFAITVMRQVGSDLLTKNARIGTAEQHVTTLVDTKSTAAYDARELEQTLLIIVTAFAEFCGREGAGCLDIAKASISLAIDGQPLPVDLASSLGCSRKKAAIKIRELLSLFSGYLEVYEGVVDRDTWRRRFR